MSKTRIDALDCSRPGTACFWCALGVLFALIAMVGQGMPTWASLLRVGSGNPALKTMTDELGPIMLLDRTGHDGQIYYLIARDPFARRATVTTLSTFDTNPPRYRYRRILFPLLGGGFGQFRGTVTLFGMTFLVALGLGLATVGIADIAFNLRLRGRAVFFAATNVGALISTTILTADVLAMGLALVGVALALRSRYGFAGCAFALACLTKDTYALVPLSVAAWLWQDRHRAFAVITTVTSCLPLIAWNAWVWTFIPEVRKSDRVVDLPFAGLLGSVSLWAQRYAGNPVQLLSAAYIAVSFTTVVLMLVLGRSRLLRWVALPWVVLALCSGNVVWDIPSNIARVFAILWPLATLMLAQWHSTQEDVRRGFLVRGTRIAAPR